MAHREVMSESGGTRTKVKSTKLDVGKLPGHFQDPENALILYRELMFDEDSINPTRGQGTGPQKANQR